MSWNTPPEPRFRSEEQYNEHREEYIENLKPNWLVGYKRIGEKRWLIHDGGKWRVEYDIESQYHVYEDGVEQPVSHELLEEILS